MQSAGQGLKRVIWSVDAFENDSQLDKRIIEALKRLQTRLHFETEPVFVLSPERAKLPLEFSEKGVESYSAMARKELDYILKSVQFPGLLSPKIITQNGYSTTRSVKALVQYAEDSEADLIVSGSHGLKGIERFLLGSFAEALLLEAHIPVMVVGRNFDKKLDFNKVLFPTDFGPQSEKNFARVLAFCKSLEAELTLFHYLPQPVEPIIQSGVYALGGGWISFEHYMKEGQDNARTELQGWAARAADAGVKSKVIVTSESMNTATAIIDAANLESAGLICMAAQSGKFTSAVLGSISRQVARISNVPVWISRS